MDVRVHAVNYGFVQSYLIEERDRLTLVDTGVAQQPRPVLELIAGLGRMPADLKLIVLTHGHADHTGSAAELVERLGAEVVAHRADAPVIRGEAEICPPVLSDLERPYAEQAASRVVPAPPCHVDVEVAGGEELDVWGGLRVIHVPGHTPGSIALYATATRTLFCGDTVASIEGRPILGFFNCDPARTAQSFRALAELDVEAAYFGHGPPVLQDAGAALCRVAERLPGMPP
jgi:glyoxylase-like metal-dependent hydrolase (beta-lactamase superfamily II)